MTQLTFKHGSVIAIAFEDNGNLDALTVHEIASANPRPGDFIFKHLGNQVAWINSAVHDLILSGQVVSGVAQVDLNLITGLKIKHNGVPTGALTANGDLHLRGSVV